jgi:predicted RNA-binding protein YlxR (DUF448 family)
LQTTAANEEGGSERTCIVTGVKDAPAAMLRFALSPDGAVVPDIRRELPGRGVWTRLSFAAVRRAASKQAFSRAFREKAEAPPALAETVDLLLTRDALQSLSMANKAGLVVAGAFKVDAAIANREVAALIQASDGAADGTAKRRQVLWTKFGPSAEIALVHLFSSGQLDLALGKVNVVHAALKPGAASSAFLARAERLRRYRTSAADTTGETVTGGWPAGGVRARGGLDDLAERPSD